MRTPLRFLIGAIVCILAAAGCDLDNYDPPQSTLQGAVTYQGEALGVRQDDIDLELWEDGYELEGDINVNVYQDGTFSSKLYDGEYKLVRDFGPWVTNRDSVIIQVDGSEVSVTSGEAQVSEEGTLMVSVTPYFVPQNVNIMRSGSTITATFDVQQIVEGSEVAEVGFYVNHTKFVGPLDPGNLDAVTQPGSEIEDMNDIELSIDLGQIENGQSPEGLYARVSVQPSSSEEALYSQVEQLD